MIREFTPHSSGLTGSTTWSCSRCGTVERGASATVYPTSLDPDELKAAVKNIGVNHIPAGWACFGKLDTRCPKCKDKKPAP